MKRWTNRQLAVGVAVLLGAVAVAWAQTSSSTVGQVNKDGAEVRAGAGSSYYVVGSLAKEDRAHATGAQLPHDGVSAQPLADPRGA